MHEIEWQMSDWAGTVRHCGGLFWIGTPAQKVSKPRQLKQITLLSSQSYHDLSLFRATVLPRAWEKLNSWESAHPRVRSALHWRDLSDPCIRARRLVGIMLWQTRVFTELPIVVNMDLKKKRGLTAFKLPPPTLSHEDRTWLKIQLELGADLLFPLTTFCVADWFESSVSYTYKTHTLFVLLVALVIVASLNSWPE